jgi:hypothetical protein
MGRSRSKHCHTVVVVVVVGMLLKKQALSHGGGGGGGYAADGGAEKREPSKFMAWNANSFLFRLKSDGDEVLSLLHRLDPNVIVIQVKKTTISLSLSLSLSQRKFAHHFLSLKKSTHHLHFGSVKLLPQELKLIISQHTQCCKN